LDYDRLHALTFNALYVCLALLTFVAIERLLYFSYLALRAWRIRAAISAAGFDPVHHIASLAANDVISSAVREYIDFQKHEAVPRERVDDLSNALFVRVDSRINARLWILDTIVTAAPLLGLLGTILGIMQTFTALAAGGVSDPAEVSRGIGTALLATAIGIGTALYGLVGLNMLSRFAEYLIDRFKVFLLRTTL
jgi:biopolymer transport protein ExbB